jgi:hypothetical protein
MRLRRPFLDLTCSQNRQAEMSGRCSAPEPSLPQPRGILREFSDCQGCYPHTVLSLSRNESLAQVLRGLHHVFESRQDFLPSARLETAVWIYPELLRAKHLARRS